VESLLVDTSVVSYLLKGHSLAPRYWEHLKGKLLGISFMSVAELPLAPLSQLGRAKNRRSPGASQGLRRAPL